MSIFIDNAPERECIERYNPFQTNILEAFESDTGVMILEEPTNFIIDERNGIQYKKCILQHGYYNGIFFGINFDNVNIVRGKTYPARKTLKRNFVWWDPNWIKKGFTDEYTKEYLGWK